jgi:hypothetical protein
VHADREQEGDHLVKDFDDFRRHGETLILTNEVKCNAEVRTQKAEVGNQKSETGNQKSEVRDCLRPGGATDNSPARSAPGKPSFEI